MQPSNFFGIFPKGTLTKSLPAGKWRHIKCKNHWIFPINGSPRLFSISENQIWIICVNPWLKSSFFESNSLNSFLDTRKVHSIFLKMLWIFKKKMPGIHGLEPVRQFRGIYERTGKLNPGLGIRGPKSCSVWTKRSETAAVRGSLPLSVHPLPCRFHLAPHRRWEQFRFHHVLSWSSVLFYPSTFSYSILIVSNLVILESNLSSASILWIQIFACVVVMTPFGWYLVVLYCCRL